MRGWIEAFGGGDQRLAERYALAVTTFLGQEPADPDEWERYLGGLSPRTRESYAYALEEFFEWIARARGRVVPPHEVTTRDAEQYANWLATRPFSLEVEKLRDGDRPVRLAIYETVRRLGSGNLSDIAAALPVAVKERFHREEGKLSDRGRAELSHELGRMVLHDLLTRTPTLEELREDNPQMGITEFIVEVPEGGRMRYLDLKDVFTYSVPKPRPVARATILQRLSALSSFWDVLARGENVPGGEPILQYNIFDPIKKRLRRGMASEVREARAAANQLSPELVYKLLEAADGPRLSDKRNAALLWFMALTGARVSEITAVRRAKPPVADEHRFPGWFDGTSEPVGVYLRRKGGSLKWLPYPPFALRALYAFQEALAEQAAPPDAQSQDPHGPNYVPPDSPRWRYQLLAIQSDAPLFPPVAFWGANSTLNYRQLKPNLPLTRGATDYRKGLSRHGVEKLLKRLAKKAGLSPEDQRKIHPHAFRAFAATAMDRMGKPRREIQAILGHDSMATTERYFAEEERPVALSGQNEILDYIAGGAPKVEPVPAAPREPPEAPPRVVETYGVPAEPVPPKPPRPGVKRPRRPKPKAPAAPPAAPEPAEEAAAVLEAEPPVALEPPDYLPAESPAMAEPAETVHATAEGPVIAVAGEPEPPAATEIREGMSPGSPYDVYEALEPTPELSEKQRADQQERIAFTRVGPRRSGQKDLAALYEKRGRDQVQQNPWLREHYDPWPLHYGLGKNSLLAWWARGNPRANGEVIGNVTDPTTGEDKTVRVPPLPVLAPDQVYPETTTARRLFTELEKLTREWMETAPTKVFGLRRWFATFAYLTRQLEEKTEGAYSWVPFDSVAKLGEGIRAHDDDYLANWFRENAGRYTTTIRLFKAQIPRQKAALEEEQQFIDVFNRTAYESVSVVEEIPDWFVSEDPVREIYDADPEEWEYFLRWIRAVTGAKLSDWRKVERSEQLEYAEDKREHTIAEARLLLERYYELTRDLAQATEEGDTESAESLRVYLFGGKLFGHEVEGITEQLGGLGVSDPKGYRDVPTVAERIERILADAFPAAPVELVDPNMLKSQLFDPEGFRIDNRKRTIVHTAEFRRRFAERFDGRDSECVMRRAARGMWEYVKRHNIQLERGRKRDTQYSMLYAVMLAYVAWIVPCPEDIERTMAEYTKGALKDEDARLAYVESMRRAVRETLFGDEDRTEEEIVLDASEHNLPAQEAIRSLEIAAMFKSLEAEDQAPVEFAAEQAGLSVTAPGVVIGRRRLRRNASDAGRRVVLLANGERPAVVYGNAPPAHVGKRRKDAPPELWLSPEVYGRSVRLMANAEQVLPSVLHMIAAMNVPVD